MKKYLFGALALPLLFACSSDDLLEEKVVGNDQFAGIEKVDATFSMDEESVTRMATQWTFEDGDQYGFAWLTDKYDALADLITCSPAPPFPLWSAPADTLRRHPHIRSWQTARAIVLYREHNPREAWTVEGLRAAGILTHDQAERLARCRVE